MSKNEMAKPQCGRNWRKCRYKECEAYDEKHGCILGESKNFPEGEKKVKNEIIVLIVVLWIAIIVFPFLAPKTIIETESREMAEKVAEMLKQFVPLASFLTAALFSVLFIVLYIIHRPKRKGES